MHRFVIRVFFLSACLFAFANSQTSPGQTTGNTKPRTLVDSAIISTLNHTYHNVNKEKHHMDKIEQLVHKTVNKGISLLKTVLEASVLDEPAKQEVKVALGFEKQIREVAGGILKILKSSPHCDTNGYSLKNIRAFSPPKASFYLPQFFHGSKPCYSKVSGLIVPALMQFVDVSVNGFPDVSMPSSERFINMVQQIAVSSSRTIQSENIMQMISSLSELDVPATYVGGKVNTTCGGTDIGDGMDAIVPFSVFCSLLKGVGLAGHASKSRGNLIVSLFGPGLLEIDWEKELEDISSLFDKEINICLYYDDRGGFERSLKAMYDAIDQVFNMVQALLPNGAQKGEKKLPENAGEPSGRDPGHTIHATKAQEEYQTTVETASTRKPDSETSVAPSDSKNSVQTSVQVPTTVQKTIGATTAANRPPTANATTSATTEVPGNNSTTSPACFPGSVVVELQDGSSRHMSELSIGDVVKVGVDQFSEVFMFTHKTANVKTHFVDIHTESGASISLTHGHYIYCDDHLMPASEVRVGCKLALGIGTSDAVVSIGSKVHRGLYNPQTIHGDIVVNGVISSTYTMAVMPSLAHGILAPFRLLNQVGVHLTFLESGGGYLSRLVPRGEM